MFASLSKKITACMLLIILLCTSIFSGIIYFQLKETATSQMKQDGSVLVKLIGRDILETQAIDKVHEQFKLFVEESEKEISYISITDEAFNIIVSDEVIDNEKMDSITGATIDISVNEQKSAISGEVSGVIFNTEEEGQVYNVSMPIKYRNGEYTLNLGISLKTMYQLLFNTSIKVLVMVLIILIGCSICAFFMSNRLVSALVSIKKGLKQVENNDLTVHINEKDKDKDELGQVSRALNKTIATLRNTLMDIREYAERACTNARELDQNTNHIFEASHQVCESTQEIASSIAIHNQGMDEISKFVHGFSEKLNQVDKQMQSVLTENQEVDNYSKVGYEKLNQLIESIQGMKQLFENSLMQITNLHQSIEKISEMSMVINSVAKQTNLLSLNASIEAARAGESGKGFAIVAGEIGALSEQVKVSSEHIDGVVVGIRDNMNTVMETNNHIADKIKIQVASLEETVGTYEKIQASTQRSSGEITELNQSVTQINQEKEGLLSGIEELSAMMNTINVATQEIASLVTGQTAHIEEVNELSKSMTNISRELEEMILAFKI